MDCIDVHAEKGQRFKIIRTSERSQVAVMTLPPGQAETNDNGHRASDQVLYVVEGRVEATVAGETRELRAGEVVIVPAGAAHRLRTVGRRPVTMLCMYGPPAYAEDRRELPVGGVTATGPVAEPGAGTFGTS